MNGFNLHNLKSISRIRTTFIDDIGNIKTGIGTDFWIQFTSPDILTFVTNHHNVNIGLKSPHLQKFTLGQIEIEIRPTFCNESNNSIGFATVQYNDLIFHPTADIAMICSPFLTTHFNKKCTVSCLEAHQWLADESFFNDYIGIGADLAFLGYPQSFCDQEYYFPIARHAIVASYPSIPFKHKKILTTNIVLVSGLSFQGGSGSPVFVASRGTKINGDKGSVESSDYCPPRLIGVMTGHLQEITPKVDTANTSIISQDLDTVHGYELERHSGLSYFTKSTSIWELFNQYKNSEVKNESNLIHTALDT